MHHVIGGQNSYAGEAAFNVEGDFVEAPSQMLEEFFRDYGVLASFAHHYQSGAVLPRELYERMSRADTYGRASGQQRQLTDPLLLIGHHALQQRFEMSSQPLDGAAIKQIEGVLQAPAQLLARLCER